MKKNPEYSAALSYSDASLGITPIVSKIPYQWRETWIDKAHHSIPYPPFTFFLKFVKDLCRVRNDPGIQFSIFVSCCDSKGHLARDCNVEVKCDMCQSDKNCIALHVNSSKGGEDKKISHGGENNTPLSFTTYCIQVRSPAFSSKFCAKTILMTIFYSWP